MLAFLHCPYEGAGKEYPNENKSGTLSGKRKSPKAYLKTPHSVAPTMKGPLTLMMPLYNLEARKAHYLIYCEVELKITFAANKAAINQITAH